MRSVLPSVGFLLLLALLLGSSCTESGRVIYFNQLNTTQALEAAKNNSDALGKECSLMCAEIAAHADSFAIIMGVAEG